MSSSSSSSLLVELFPEEVGDGVAKQDSPLPLLAPPVDELDVTVVARRERGVFRLARLCFMRGEY